MTESVAMSEIRKIKNENSLRYRKMSSDELAKEFDESIKRFIKRMSKDIKVVSIPNKQN
jgi:hypothetical protein